MVILGFFFKYSDIFFNYFFAVIVFLFYFVPI